MKTHLRMLSALLSASLLVSAAAPAAGAAGSSPGGPKGTIDVTVRLDFEQNQAALENHQAQVALQPKGGGDTVTAHLWEARGDDGMYGGIVRRTYDENSVPDCIDVAFEHLDPGEYTLSFTGDGYKTHTVDVRLEDYSQYVSVGTGDATFTLGDFDGNGRVDAADRAAVAAALDNPGSLTAGEAALYDLNGDGEVNIIDLAYVNHNIEATGSGEIQNTGWLLAAAESVTGGGSGEEEIVLWPGSDLQEDPIEPSEAVDAVTAMLQGNGSVSIAHVSADGGEPVKISEDDPLTIRIGLHSTEETSQVNVLSSKGEGEIEAGTIQIEGTDETGNPYSRRFAVEELPKGIYALDINGENHRTVAIDLGRRVVVKTITITVTKTQGGDYATVDSIQFLKDIVPENPVPQNVSVKGLSAAPGSESVTLKWGALPNVTGYRIDYSMVSNPGRGGSVECSTATRTVTGLTNLQEYTFTVTPKNGSWEGQPVSVTATPVPNQRPAKVNMVNVTAGDGLLNVSWKAGKHAASYQVLYGTDPDSTSGYQAVTVQGQSGTSAQLTGLTNNTLYYVYVVARNELGDGPLSTRAEGTPKAVVYDRPEGIPENVIGEESIESIRLANANNWSGKQFPNAADRRPGNMADGDYKTYWMSQSWDDGNFTLSKEVLCTFKEPQDLSSVIWVPRLDGTYYANMRLYAVRVWYDGDDLNGPGTVLIGGGDKNTLWANVGNVPAETKFAVLPFEPQKNVKQIGINIEQVDYRAVTLSELLFQPYDAERDVPTKINALFQDPNLHTQLKTTATQAGIDEIRALLAEDRAYYLYPETLEDDLALAEELLKTGESSGVLLNGVNAARTPETDYQQGGSNLQALGVAAKRRDHIVVYADGLAAGETVTIYASKFNAEVSAWLATVGTVRNGRNLLTIPQIGSSAAASGGSLYYTYSGSHPGQVRLHIRCATDIPVLELFDWYDIGEAERGARIDRYLSEAAAYQGTAKPNAQSNVLNVTEISLPSVLLSLPATSVESRDRQALYNAILAWEDVMHICMTTQGIDKTYGSNDMATRQNIRCMTMFEGAFMYAAGSHIGIGYGSCGGMTGGTPIGQLATNASSNNLYGWGIAHEIGHNMDKLGKAEITNNLYSLMVQTYDGGQNTLKSRLETSGKYPAIFTKTAQKYPGASNDVFVQLGMYWQLHLAYDGGGNPMWFYNQFFKDWKAGTYTGGASSYDDRVALTAAGVVKKDLTEFFTRWGMTLSGSTKATLAGYEKEPRAIWYLDDDSRRDRLNGDTPTTGTVSAAAAMADGSKTEVKLTISAAVTGGSGKVQGYEIRRDGTPIGFALAGAGGNAEYLDPVNAANHRAFEYTVAGYDSLGNEIGSADAGEIRIAYDATLPTEAYESREISDGVLTVTLREETAVSGILVSGSWTDGGDFSVSVTDAAGKTTEQARTGSFTAAENQAADDTSKFLAYFRKPHAGSTDTRIWTYDAKTATITGLPGGVSAGEIELISYAGDDIAFYPKAAVGILSADYPYGDGADEIIKAGTLVIIGTYRSDPLWNAIRVVGEFTITTDTENPTTERRDIPGKAYILAEVPEDGAVSDISDGIFLFVPDMQAEKALQGVIEDGKTGQAPACTGVNLLPSRMKLELRRTDDPSNTASTRVTAETLWLNTPGGTDIPYIVLNSEVAD